MKDQKFMFSIIEKPLEERSDREIEISKIILQRESNLRLSSIQKNLQFFFWITIISIGIIILAYILGEM